MELEPPDEELDRTTLKECLENIGMQVILVETPMFIVKSEPIRAIVRRSQGIKQLVQEAESLLKVGVKTIALYKLYRNKYGYRVRWGYRVGL